MIKKLLFLILTISCLLLFWNVANAATGRTQVPIVTRLNGKYVVRHGSEIRFTDGEINPQKSPRPHRLQNWNADPGFSGPQLLSTKELML